MCFSFLSWLKFDRENLCKNINAGTKSWLQSNMQAILKSMIQESYKQQWSDSWSMKVIVISYIAKQLFYLLCSKHTFFYGKYTIFNDWFLPRNERFPTPLSLNNLCSIVLFCKFCKFWNFFKFHDDPGNIYGKRFSLDPKGNLFPKLVKSLSQLYCWSNKSHSFSLKHVEF